MTKVIVLRIGNTEGGPWEAEGVYQLNTNPEVTFEGEFPTEEEMFMAMGEWLDQAKAQSIQMEKEAQDGKES